MKEEYILKRNSELIDCKEFDSYSLTSKLSALRHNCIITDNDYKRLRGALNLEKAIKDIKTEIEEQKKIDNEDDDVVFSIRCISCGLNIALDIINKYIGE